jgi:hypothetical protein
MLLSSFRKMIGIQANTFVLTVWSRFRSMSMPAHHHPRQTSLYNKLPLNAAHYTMHYLRAEYISKNAYLS